MCTFNSHAVGTARPVPAVDGDFLGLSPSFAAQCPPREFPTCGGVGVDGDTQAPLGPRAKAESISGNEQSRAGLEPARHQPFPPHTYPPMLSDYALGRCGQYDSYDARGVSFDEEERDT